MAFLLPLLGGQLQTDAWPLEPGYVPTVQSLFRGFEIATLQHALLALLVVAAFVYLVIKRKIVQVPHAWISGPLAAFLALLLGSVFISGYRWVSETAFAQWTVYALALLAAVAGLGRRRGPSAVLAALCAGSVLTALVGIVEYGQERSAGNASWRIFANWNNPNALASMLVIGLVLCIGFFFIEKDFAKSLLPAAGALIIGIALLLTGSKGGMLSAAAGVPILCLLQFAWKNEDQPRSARLKAGGLLGVFGLLALAFAAIFVLKIGAHTPIGRLVNPSSTMAQSADFRGGLTKSAIAIIAKNPLGTGLGTFEYHSSEPGITTRTELAHRTIYQLASEASPLAAASFVALVVGWLLLAFRSARQLPYQVNTFRAAVVAAVIASLVNSRFESNLYYFGVGLAFFLLLGVGIQLSTDAGAPEFVAPPMRIAAVLLAVVCAGQLIFAGTIAKMQANARWLAQNKDPEGAAALAEQLRSIAPFDGETWYFSGFLARSPEDALRDFKEAADTAPSPKYLRRLAMVQVQSGHADDAEPTLRRALALDPNNLQALKQLMDLEDHLGRQDEAQMTARRMIAVEDTPYFKVRAIPESIPTETYEARTYLVKFAPKDQVELLREAVEGLRQFARVTLPYARKMDSAGGVGGLSGAEAERKVEGGIQAAKDLEKLYTAVGDRKNAEWAQGVAGELGAAVADGNK